MRTYCSVPKLGQHTLTLERSKKLFKLNQFTAIVGCFGVLGLCSFVARPVDTPSDRSVDLDALRYEVNRLSQENALMKGRIKSFRSEFNDLQSGFSDFSTDLAKASDAGKVSSGKLADILSYSTDLGFTLVNLESNLQYLEKRVAASDPADLSREVSKLSSRLGQSQKVATLTR